MFVLPHLPISLQCSQCLTYYKLLYGQYIGKMSVGQAVKVRKICFVTIGATAAFDALIRAALSPLFLEALHSHSYTDLRLQYGKDGATILDDFKARNGVTHGLNISGFAFNKQGLGVEMRAAKGGPNGEEGVVISHAGKSKGRYSGAIHQLKVRTGSGSVLDALRIAVPLIVVPNPELLDNHQVELAEQMASIGYVVHGNLKSV